MQVCTNQQMEDGRVRERNQLPSEKIYDGEEALVGALPRSPLMAVDGRRWPSMSIDRI